MQDSPSQHLEKDVFQVQWREDIFNNHLEAVATDKSVSVVYHSSTIRAAAKTEYSASAESQQLTDVSRPGEI